MADPIVIRRVAQRLQEAGEALPKGEGFWPALAEIATDEALRTVVVQQQPLPSDPFLAVMRMREGLRVINTRMATLALATQAATTFLEEHGAGEVWIVEVRRVVAAV